MGENDEGHKIHNQSVPGIIKVGVTHEEMRCYVRSWIQESTQDSNGDTQG